MARQWQEVLPIRNVNKHSNIPTGTVPQKGSSTCKLYMQITAVHFSAEIGEAADAWTLARAIDRSVGQNSARS